MKELHQLILAGESETLDFKKRIAQPDRIARTLASFANTRGGIILVGVMDNGQITGIDPEEEKHLLTQAATQFCQPPVQIFFKEMEEDDKTVLKVIIPESREKPHLVKFAEEDWREYIRINDETVQTGKRTEEELIPPTVEKILPQFEPEELFLLDFLAKNQRITLKQFSRLVKLPHRLAYQTLVRMVLAGAIRFHQKEKEEYYTLR